MRKCHTSKDNIFNFFTSLVKTRFPHQKKQNPPSTVIKTLFSAQKHEYSIKRIPKKERKRENETGKKVYLVDAESKASLCKENNGKSCLSIFPLLFCLFQGKKRRKKRRERKKDNGPSFSSIIGRVDSYWSTLDL